MLFAPAVEILRSSSGFQGGVACVALFSGPLVRAGALSGSTLS